MKKIQLLHFWAGGEQKGNVVLLKIKPPDSFTHIAEVMQGQSLLT